MSRIDPNNVVVLVRDSSDAIVRIGVSSWQTFGRSFDPFRLTMSGDSRKSRPRWQGYEGRRRGSLSPGLAARRTLKSCIRAV